ncbi:MAG: hypothetical protein QOE68_30 [Thermoanaerobaculia bacterium]|nr:hypothetical protein [Thermoanaerobaculia bacterium]
MGDEDILHRGRDPVASPQLAGFRSGLGDVLEVVDRVVRYGRYAASSFCSFFASLTMSGSLAVVSNSVSAFAASR